VAGNSKMVYPEMVTHPSINWARRTVTMLIETNVLPLSQATKITDELSTQFSMFFCRIRWCLFYVLTRVWFIFVDRSC